MQALLTSLRAPQQRSLAVSWLVLWLVGKACSGASRRLEAQAAAPYGICGRISALRVGRRVIDGTRFIRV